MIELAAKDGTAVGTALASIYPGDESLAFRNLFELATRYVHARAHGKSTAQLHTEREAYEQSGQAAYRAARPTTPPPAEEPAPPSIPLIKPELEDEPVAPIVVGIPRPGK